MIYKVFISSRNNDTLKLDRSPGSTLTQLRLFLKEELEKEKFLGKDILEISINEKFATDGTENSYNQCLKEIEDADHTIALFGGSSGWAPDSIDIGICHAELARALEISQRQVSIMDISEFVNYPVPVPLQVARDENFNAYLLDQNRFNHPFKLYGDETEENFRTQLLEQIMAVIRKSIEERIKFAGRSYLANGGGQKMLEWKTMDYAARDEQIRGILKPMMQHDYSEIISVISAVPDSFSVPEAQNYCGRAFLNDQHAIQLGAHSGLEKGPLHLVGVYGTVTETQVRKLLGNPDIVTMKDDFGIYVWERKLNIQMVFLSKCTTPEATKTQYNLFNIWLKSNGMTGLIKNRAQARHLILKALIAAEALLV